MFSVVRSIASAVRQVGILRLRLLRPREQPALGMAIQILSEGLNEQATGFDCDGE